MLAAAWLFIKGLPWKWLGPGLIALGLAALLVTGVNQIRGWRDQVYSEAYLAGQTQANAAWQQTRAEESRQALLRFAQQVEANNTAVKGYLADIAAREPLVQQTTREIERYASTTAGSTVCLDADGVRILQQARAAATATPGSPAANPRP